MYEADRGSIPHHERLAIFQTGYARRRRVRRHAETCENPPMAPPADPMLVAAIDALLPQTQCTRCGYPACNAYAEAIARDEARINQCPPGGAAGIASLAALLGRAIEPLNPANGVEKPPEVALIDEAACIGCMKCIQACPVDAIVGASKLMHTVLADECNGCELCIPPCPVDCITMIPSADPTPASAHSARYRERYVARNARLAREAGERADELERKKAAIDAGGGGASAVQAAIARARARKAAGGGTA
jgi:electron transport complex protein RnfB